MKKHLSWLLPLIIVWWIFLFHTTGIKPAVYGEFGPTAWVSDQYVDYSEQAVAWALDQQKDVVIYFGANWCPTCTRFEDKMMGSLSDIPENIMIFAADVDRDEQAKQTYGVRSQSTTVYLWNNWETLERRVARDHSLWDIVRVVESL